MIVNEAHIQFKAGADKQDSLNSANFTTAEIDLLLSNAQEEILEQRAYGNNVHGTSLEETQKRVKDLQSITKNANITSFLQNSDNKPTGVFVELPSDYRHAINEEVTAESTDCNGETITQRIIVQPLMHTKYNKVMQNPFSKPSDYQVYRLPYGRVSGKEYHEIILPSGYTLKTYHLRYLKNPKKIDKAGRLTPPGLTGTDEIEMSDSICREIVQLAIRNALADIEAPRTTEQIQRLKEIE